jgi:hypothetical protein
MPIQQVRITNGVELQVNRGSGLRITGDTTTYFITDAGATVTFNSEVTLTANVTFENGINSVLSGEWRFNAPVFVGNGQTLSIGGGGQGIGYLLVDGSGGPGSGATFQGNATCLFQTGTSLTMAGGASGTLASGSVLTAAAGSQIVLSNGPSNSTTDPGANNLACGPLMPKAWGIVSTNGTGGVTVFGGVNLVASIVTVGSNKYILLAFVRNMADANYAVTWGYQPSAGLLGVLVSSMMVGGPDAVPGPTLNAFYINVQQFDNGGTKTFGRIDPSGTQAFSVHVTVMGRQ